MTDFASRARDALADQGISMRQAARALNYDVSYLSRVLKGKQRPSENLRRGLDRLTGAEGALLAANAEVAVAAAAAAAAAAGDGAGDDLEAVELARRVRASDVGAETLDRLESAFDQFAVRYQTASPPELLRDVRQHLGYVTKLLDDRKTLSEHRRLIVLGGWLSLLAATLHVDLRQSRAAAARLTTAASLAQHAEHHEIHAWTYETEAWRALTTGDYPRAVELSRAAQYVAPRGGSAELQATAQEGRARARLGQRREAYAAIERVQHLATTMVLRAQPEHHYQYDPAKATSYTATTLAWMGDAAAEQPAREVIAQFDLGGDATSWPRRAVSAHIDLALTLLSCDRLDEACDAARRAIASGRLLPANHWRALEIVRVVEGRGLPEAVELREAYEELKPWGGGG
ncbi:helix-turn-helix domain-containing protein [Streptomyces aureoverticillatus]|uniref:helix-turn-helix domain-containing protein n=1 Tax=Streptomyces aureoverticillatus TaxID=66871 RepID=UPI0013DD105F|nr:helix-turn-helix domain-containing protein [Streptomyces aureoverticillatus]QIB45463.1 helix-turn-helix domain-containing protein [Streptomyces aureoverticillatus]